MSPIVFRNGNRAGIQYIVLVMFETDIKTSDALHLKPMARMCAVFAAALLLASVFLISCASKSPEMVLEESVASELDSFKNRDSYTMQRFAEYMDIQELEQFGIDPQSFARKYFEGFAYRIEGIDVGTDTATVYITLTMKEYSQFEEKLQTAVDSLVEADIEKSYSSERFKELYGKAVMDCLDDTRSTRGDELSLVFIKDGNAWHPENEVFITVASQAVK